jgi:hypothetical protein
MERLAYTVLPRPPWVGRSASWKMGTRSRSICWLGELTLHVSDETMTARRSAWTAPAREPMPGYLADFCATVAQANMGCVSSVYNT